MRESTCDKFLVLDKSKRKDKTSFVYFIEDKKLKKFYDGKLPDDALLNPSKNDIELALFRAFANADYSRKDALVCAKKVFDTGDGIIPMFIYDIDVDEDEHVFITNKVQLLSVDDPVIR